MTKEELKKIIEKEGGDCYKIGKNGYVLSIRRTEMIGCLCGYVGVPEESPLYGQNYYHIGDNNSMTNIEKDIADISVHGGLTFSGEHKDDYLSFLNGKKYWFFGFDCAHHNDLTLSHFSFKNSWPDIDDYVYRDKKYVKKECDSLARQIKKIENKYK